jgi:hypothetical protein
MEELKKSLTNSEEKDIVQIYSQILYGEFKEPYIQAIEKAEKAAKEFILRE